MSTTNTANGSPKIGPLPEPQTLLATDSRLSFDQEDVRPRLSRQSSNNMSGMSAGKADILVRLVGHWHARCAILYFLCYLLSSSITILIGLRLMRLCGWSTCHGQQDNNPTEIGSVGQSSQTTKNSGGFYYRTRLGKLESQGLSACLSSLRSLN